MIDIVVPAELEGTQTSVSAWLKHPGDAVRQNDALVELETDKAVQEVAAPCDGVLREILLTPGAPATPGALLGRMQEAGAADAAAAQPHATAPNGPAATPTQSGSSRAWLSPSVRQAVHAHHVDIREITGTGRHGRITRADVDRYVAQRGAAAEVAAPIAAPAAATPPAASSRAHSIPHSAMRRRIAQNMVQSLAAAPHVTAVFHCDFGAVMAHRKRHQAAFAARGVPLTYTAYIVLACVAAMKAVPQVNSRWYDDRLEVYEDINIGIGTALGDAGLVVPVIRQAQNLSLLGAATRLDALTRRARAGQLTPADMQGGTFSISNHGVSGSLFAAPIVIVQPQSAILGVGKIEKQVVVREVDSADTLQIRPMAYVTLTLDHRVLDAYQANGWLAQFVATLEHWPVDGAAD